MIKFYFCEHVEYWSHDTITEDVKFFRFKDEVDVWVRERMNYTSNKFNLTDWKKDEYLSDSGRKVQMLGSGLVNLYVTEVEI